MNLFRRNTSKTKRSPLKARPLRYAGQSLDEEFQKIWDDKISEYIFWISMFLAFAIFEWVRWYLALPPQPVLFTVIALLAGGYGLLRIRGYRQKIRDYRLGRDGERAVGQFLEALREKGYRVFHDIPGNSGSKAFNIDHVLIGKSGIFSIETKTRNKPENGSSKIFYTGETVSVNGSAPDSEPIVQAKAQADWLVDKMKESTGRSFKIRPVVLYPGWFISKHPKGARVWVLEPKALPSFLEHENDALSAEDVALAAYHLSRYVRAGERNQ